VSTLSFYAGGSPPYISEALVCTWCPHQITWDLNGLWYSCQHVWFLSVIVAKGSPLMKSGAAQICACLALLINLLGVHLSLKPSKLRANSLSSVQLLFVHSLTCWLVRCSDEPSVIFAETWGQFFPRNYEQQVSITAAYSVRIYVCRAQTHILYNYKQNRSYYWPM
jgi:hypothetical protein